MILDIFEKLIYNAALLLALSIAYDMMITHKFDNRAFAKIITGIIIGMIGLAVMIGPWKLNSGTVIDARTILFSVAALFFGGKHRDQLYFIWAFVAQLSPAQRPALYLYGAVSIGRGEPSLNGSFDAYATQRNQMGDDPRSSNSGACDLPSGYCVDGEDPDAQDLAL